MKAVQTRSPISLFYQNENVDNVFLSIWISNTVNIDVTTTPGYILSTSAVNGLASFEISELIRSKNNYIFNEDFYSNRDTAKYVLVRARLIDEQDNVLQTKYDFLRVRDGYVQRNELPQIYKNLIKTNINEWDVKLNATITADQLNPFNGSDAYLVEDSNTSNQFVISEPLAVTGIHTLSVFIKDEAVGNLYSIGTKATSRMIVNLATNEITNLVNQDNSILAYDISIFGDYKMLSIAVNVNEGESFRIVSEEVTPAESALIFNPTVIKGNQINQGASDLILQDNFTIFSDGVINPQIGFDLKFTNGSYNYGIQDLNFINQSVFRNFSNLNLVFDDSQGIRTIQSTRLINTDECKHTPTKVSFVNRFGVIQDLVFFKKREDNIRTTKEEYMANVLQGGEYYSHIGQKQTISKESERRVTLNTGFYPEDFNTVFEQLQNSLYYWIDDEPASLEDTQFDIKTKVNDKLINYTFEFSYGNSEINTIR